jgi:catechol 2,3-dioxygenase-like lactoylglutathione lyase family enzyme
MVTSRQSVLVIPLVFLFGIAAAFLIFSAYGSGFQVRAETTGTASPRVDHILLNVSNMEASIAFYRDMIGLRLKSPGSSFSILEAGNLGVYLSTSPRSWQKPLSKEERLGVGMYPHFEIEDVPGLVDRLKKAGYKIVQEAQAHSWGTEAFAADPDGYVWALFSPPKKR